MVILRARILQSGLIFNRCYGVFHGAKVFVYIVQVKAAQMREEFTKDKKIYYELTMKGGIYW